MRRKRAEALIFAGFLLILAGTSALVRPFFVRAWEEAAGLRFICRIMLPSENADEMTAMKARAAAYNAEIAKEQAAHGFIYEDTYTDPVYDSLLGGPLGMMCVIEIPKIGVLLPVGHGTSSGLLAEYAGHLHGSSLPTGGPSAHAVIAAHAGLPDRELFTGLPRLVAGDEFCIYVFGEKHVYTIDQIREILPSETDCLRITTGRDYVTLMTCVPYGINTRRLLVRGVRSDGSERTAVSDLAKIYHSRLLRLVLRIAVLIMVPMSEILFYIICRRR